MQSIGRMAIIKREQERVNHGERIQGIIDEVCYNKMKCTTTEEK